MNPNPVNWFEIYVQDMDRAKAFYEGVFNMAFQPLGVPPDTQEECGDDEIEMWSFPMSDDHSGASGALVRMDDVPSGPGGTLVYFSCEDCATEAARAAEHGGGIFRDKMAIGEHGFIAMVTDTEGNMIGLHSMK